MIKDWKPHKYGKVRVKDTWVSKYGNSISIKRFHAEWMVDCGSRKIGQKPMYFKTKYQAIKFAKQYMGKH